MVARLFFVSAVRLIPDSVLGLVHVPVPVAGMPPGSHSNSPDQGPHASCQDESKNTHAHHVLVIGWNSLIGN